jgi:hypothetical protein
MAKAPGEYVLGTRASKVSVGSQQLTNIASANVGGIIGQPPP